jgi:radical SAM superfamily enzyme YgiQ (UPF0313 family)
MDINMQDNIFSREMDSSIDILLIQCDPFNSIAIEDYSMGLLYIATFLESKGFKVKIISTMNLIFTSNEQFRDKIKSYNPKITGFYTISDNIDLVLHRAEEIKKWMPDTWVVLGGPAAVSDGERLLKYPFIDGVVTGEGEYATEIICQAIIKGQGDLSSAPGLIYRQNGNICYGSPVEYIQELDTLPSPDVKYFKHSQFFRMVSGRGCPYKCAFCFQAGHGPKYRFRSAENLLNEIITKMEAHPFNIFSFIDDVFMMDTDRCMQVALGLEEYRKRTNRDFLFFCHGRVNVLENRPDLIQALARVGMVRLQLGIESGDPDILKIYRKQITKDHVRKVVECVRDTGTATVIGGFIMGGPFESEKTVTNTIDFAVELINLAPGVFVPQAGLLGGYPGTPIMNDPASFGLTEVEHDFAKGTSLTDVQFVSEYFNTKASMRGVKRRFDSEMRKAITKSLPAIPRSLLQLYYRWGERNVHYSQIYPDYLVQLQATKQYFKYLESPRFQTINKIHPEEIDKWYPMRVIEHTEYNEDGSIPLSNSVINVTLTELEEKIIYELSSGKLNIKQLAEELKAKLNLNNGVSEIIQNKLMPIFKKLDKTYHLVFRE